MNNLSIEELKEMRAYAYSRYLERFVRLIDETIAIREMKGDHVPVGFAVMDENHDWHIDFCGKEHALSHGDSLFTAPQKPVVKLAGDMPRAPFNYGMYAKGWNDRGFADKLAIEAAGGIVKDGE